MHVTESIVHFRNINYSNFKAALISVFTLLLYFFPSLCALYTYFQQHAAIYTETSDKLTLLYLPSTTQQPDKVR